MPCSLGRTLALARILPEVATTAGLMVPCSAVPKVYDCVRGIQSVLSSLHHRGGFWNRQLEVRSSSCACCPCREATCLTDGHCWTAHHMTPDIHMHNSTHQPSTQGEGRLENGECSGAFRRASVIFGKNSEHHARQKGTQHSRPQHNIKPESLARCMVRNCGSLC